MIDNYLLEELVTFAKYGTLLATAEHLQVTQPTVTRGMQKLEDDLGVKIFDRQPNRITLTQTGKMAVVEAKKVLQQNQQSYDAIRNFDLSQRILKIGTTAPGPRLVTNSLNLPTNVQVQDQFIDPESVSKQLIDHNFSLIITNEEIQTPLIESRYLGTENLFVNLDQFTYLANKTSVSFKELKGLSFVVLTDIAMWKEIIQNQIPHAKFLYQQQTDAFKEITKYSNFPYFSTNLSALKPQNNSDADDDRVQIPITDDSAKMDFYVTYLTAQKNRITPIFDQLNQAWI